MIRRSLFKRGRYLAGFSLCVLIFTACSQESLIFFPESLPADFKFSFAAPFEEIVLPVNGGAIHALRFRADRPRGAVLYFHGNAGSLRTWGGIAPEFTTRGYDLLIPDYRGFGKSRGKIEGEDMLLQDGITAYRYLLRFFAEERVVVYGRSIGTGIAAHVAKAGRPRMLILESPYFNLIDLAAHHYPLVPRALLQSFLRYPLRTDLWIGKVACPVYLFHGTRDSIIPYHASERLMGILGSRGRLIRIEGGGHNDLETHPLYQRTLSAILQ